MRSEGEKEMQFVYFFAGIGGIRLGLEQAGHKCVGFCEFDKYARTAYKAMYDTEGEWENHDVRTVKPYDVPAAVEAASANNNIKSTGSVIAKKVGGSATIILPDNQKLQLVTWKNDNMWVLYRPMRADEQAETYTYQEDSKFGLIEAKITIREVKR